MSDPRFWNLPLVTAEAKGFLVKWEWQIGTGIIFHECRTSLFFQVVFWWLPMLVKYTTRVRTGSKFTGTIRFNTNNQQPRPTTNTKQSTINKQQPTTNINNQQPTTTVAFAPLQPRHIVVGGETSSFIPRAERQDLKELEEYQWGNSTQAVRVCWWRFQSRKLLETGWSGRWRYGGVFFFWKASKNARKSSLAGLEMRKLQRFFHGFALQLVKMDHPTNRLRAGSCNMWIEAVGCKHCSCRAWLRRCW